MILKTGSMVSKKQDFEGQNDLRLMSNSIRAIIEHRSRYPENILLCPRLFSRMEKQDKSEICVLSPEHRKILEKITHDPASALEHDLESFFAEVKPRIENGSLGLKDQMCEKALKQVDKLHSSEALASLREQRKEYSLQLEKAMSELNSLRVYRGKEQFCAADLP